MRDGENSESDNNFCHFSISQIMCVCVYMYVYIYIIFVPFCSDNPVLNFTRNLHPPREGVVRGSEMQDNVLVAAIVSPEDGRAWTPRNLRQFNWTERWCFDKLTVTCLLHFFLNLFGCVRS